MPSISRRGEGSQFLHKEDVVRVVEGGANFLFRHRTGLADHRQNHAHCRVRGLAAPLNAHQLLVFLQLVFPAQLLLLLAQAQEGFGLLEGGLESGLPAARRWGTAPENLRAVEMSS